MSVIHHTMATDYIYDAKVEYLESTGTQYIDTGVILKSNYKYELTFSCASSKSGTKIPFGMYSVRAHDTQAIKDNFAVNCYEQWNKNNVQILLYFYPDNGVPDPSFPNAVQIASRNVVQEFGKANVVSYDNGVVWFNGQEILNRPSSMPNNPYNIPAYLFASSVQQSDRSIIPNYFFDGRIMNLKIKDAGYNLVCDLIPVRVGSVGYMYDKVSGKLFGNAGTGAFILGSDAASANGGGYNRRCIRRSYRRSWRASMRFSPRHLWKEVA